MEYAKGTGHPTFTIDQYDNVKAFPRQFQVCEVSACDDDDDDPSDLEDDGGTTTAPDTDDSL